MAGEKRKEIVYTQWIPRGFGCGMSMLDLFDGWNDRAFNTHDGWTGSGLSGFTS